MNSPKLDKSKIYEPIYQITTVRELLLFTLRICDMLKKGEIEENKLNQNIVVDNIVKIECNWKSENYTDFANNLRLCVLGNCFVVIDEALNRIFGDKPEKFSNNDIDALRAIIYMLRCAISHGPTAPRWKAEGKYCKNFKIEEIGYELKVKELNGQYIQHGQYGGIAGAISLINYSLEIARRYSSSN